MAVIKFLLGKRRNVFMVFVMLTLIVAALLVYLTQKLSSPCLTPCLSPFQEAWLETPADQLPQGKHDIEHLERSAAIYNRAYPLEGLPKSSDLIKNISQNYSEIPYQYRNLGEAFLREGDLKNAELYLGKAASYGDKLSQYSLAKLYETSTTGVVDSRKPYLMYLLCAQSDFRDCAYKATQIKARLSDDDLVWIDEQTQAYNASFDVYRKKAAAQFIQDNTNRRK